MTAATHQQEHPLGDVQQAAVISTWLTAVLRLPSHACWPRVLMVQYRCRGGSCCFGCEMQARDAAHDQAAPATRKSGAAVLGGAIKNCQKCATSAVGATDKVSCLSCTKTVPFGAPATARLLHISHIAAALTPRHGITRQPWQGGYRASHVHLWHPVCGSFS